MGKLKDIVKAHKTRKAMTESFLDVAYTALLSEIARDRTDWNSVRDMIDEIERTERP